MISCDLDSKIGIVISVYNVEKYLRKCLDSILEQDYGNFQVCLVNDGSIDSSLEIALEYVNKDSRFILIDKKNGGASNARNVGIDFFSKKITFDKTDGIYANESLQMKAYALKTTECLDIDYIMFLDSDDYLHKNCFSTCIKDLLDSRANVLMFDYFLDVEVDSSDVPPETWFEMYHYDSNRLIDSREWLLQGMKCDISHFAFVCFGMIDFRFLSRIHLRFIDGVTREDVHFGTILLFLADSIYIETQKLYYYRIRSNSMSGFGDSSLISPYMQSIYDAFLDVNTAKSYHVESSFFIMLLEIMKYVEGSDEKSIMLKVGFFSYLMKRSFALFKFSKDPLNLKPKLKILKDYVEDYFPQNLNILPSASMIREIMDYRKRGNAIRFYLKSIERAVVYAKRKKKAKNMLKTL